MITTEVAKKLLPLVNNDETMRDLGLYVQSRVEFLKNELVTAKDMATVNSLQGRINELLRFNTLRNEVISRSRDKEVN